MFAAQAAEISGYSPVIISRKRKSVIYGAQYLHKPIPDLTDIDSAKEIRTYRRGRAENYAHRVYGDAQTVTSWQKVQSRATCWDLRSTYATAWEKFGPNIIDWDVSPADVKDFTESFDLVISTIPLWSICTRNHPFVSVPIMVKKDFEGLDIEGYGNFVIYNGTEVGIWYRASRIFGHQSVEAPAMPELEGQGWDAGFKVGGNECDCHPSVVRAGRMGKWERGVLTHHAFNTAVEAISERLGLWTDQPA